MLYLDADQTRAALPMPDAIEAMEHAFSGHSEAPLRSLVGSSLVMPARLDDHMAVKVVSTVPGNPVGLVMVFDGEGSPLGILDGPTLTAIRTGAVSGLATRLLASEDARTLAMLGAGAMAADQIEAVRAVRNISTVRVWSRSLEKAEALASSIGGEAVAEADQAVSGADVISCATPAREPLFADESTLRSVHVNAVGAFTPGMAEVNPETLRRSFVVVDDIEAAGVEAGDLLQARVEPDATLRDLMAGSIPETWGTSTVFKSVGIGAQDVAAGVRALINARRDGIGLDLG